MKNINKEKDDQSRIKMFLKDLTKLTKKYKIIIAGCGCCGSPYLIDINDCKDKEINDKYYVVNDLEKWNNATNLYFKNIDED